ncbi:hypothetical protein [Halolactibacillus sp. JCM 19043]|uniref:hypothetical protein n=1 Tax=Halolactibacillus sp. JCM 19043 TaxID=1460638 RepID=UPI00078170D2|nr:hypothetical protein [Halolactibacillus sp. JCM 19043]
MDVLKTSQWMKRHARPLEYARWKYLFEGGERESVRDCLQAYQNDDGGFGHGLEPDYTMPYSSAIQTWSACRIINELNLPKEDPVVEAVVQYLINTFDEKTGLYQTVVPDMNQYPHAMHWHYEDGVQANWGYNPTVELAAYLKLWSADERSDIIVDQILTGAIEHLLTIETMNFHELNNYQQLLMLLKGQLPKEQQLHEKVTHLKESAFSKDPSTFGKTYQGLPMDVIEDQKDELYPKYESLIQAHCDYLSESITEEGICLSHGSGEGIKKLF